MSSERRFLPEWTPQSGVLLTWPRPDGDWGAAHALAEHTFAAIAAAVSLRELVVAVCVDNRHAEKVRRLLETAGGDPGRLRAWIAPSNDAWARDHGPLSVATPNGARLLDFTFNGWGGKYPAQHDNALTRTLAALGAFDEAPIQPVDFVLEGGSIETDGDGTLLTSASCLLSPARNPGLSRTDIEARLADWLGIERVLWLEHGKLAGDDTDGHVDTLARFCDPYTIAYQSCHDRDDGHFEILGEMAEELRALRRADHKSYRLVPLPWPKPVYAADGGRLPATYANFLIINDAVLVPTYADPADAEALDALAACFPEREIIGVDCRPLIQQFGSLHCATMQLSTGIVR
jgi:agmatine deiminase